MTAHYFLNGIRHNVDVPTLPLSIFRKLFRSGYWLMPSLDGSMWVVYPYSAGRVRANPRWGTFSKQELIKFVEQLWQRQS